MFKTFWKYSGDLYNYITRIIIYVICSYIFISFAGIFRHAMYLFFKMYDKYRKYKTNFFISNTKVDAKTIAFTKIYPFNIYNKWIQNVNSNRLFDRFLCINIYAICEVERKLRLQKFIGLSDILYTILRLKLPDWKWICTLRQFWMEKGLQIEIFHSFCMIVKQTSLDNGWSGGYVYYNIVTPYSLYSKLQRLIYIIFLDPWFIVECVWLISSQRSKKYLKDVIILDRDTKFLFCLPPM